MRSSSSSYTGTILRVVGRPSDRTLTDTGCVDPNNPLHPVDGLFPYDVNVGAWASGASAVRHLAIPEAGAIGVEETGKLVLPPGSVAMKTLITEGRRVETQLLVRERDGSWTAETYAWTRDGLSPQLATTRTDVALPSGRTHVVDPETCTTCHAPDRGTTLGLEVAQLDRDGVDYGARRGNPLTTLVELGMIGGATTMPSYRPLPRIDGLGRIEERAEAYLHANCAFCHDGRAGDAERRFDTPLAKAGLCGVTSARGTRLVPGRPDESTLLTVLRSEDPAVRMPPVGRSAVDEHAVGLIADFIRFTTACPGE